MDKLCSSVQWHGTIGHMHSITQRKSADTLVLDGRYTSDALRTRGARWLFEHARGID